MKEVKIFEDKYEFTDVWISSDIHWGHTNICLGESKWVDKDKCRNFENLTQMNITILEGINENVKETDLLVLLGDTLMGKKDYNAFFDSLICKNIVILHGNHTHRKNLNTTSHPSVKFVGDYVELIIGKQLVICSHYPMFHWNKQEEGSFMLRGHLHGDTSEIINQIEAISATMDVGIDVAFKLFGKYRPFNFLEIEEILKTKTSNYLKHH